MKGAVCRQCPRAVAVTNELGNAKPVELGCTTSAELMASLEDRSLDGQQ